MGHRSFWLELGAKIGPPMVAGTIVAALLQHRFALEHGLLLAAGLALTFAAHRAESHS